MGGTISAIEAEYQQGEIQEAAYRWQKQIDEHQRLIVGVNSYHMEEQTHPKLLQANPALQAEQIQRLEQLRAERDSTAVADALARLTNAAAASDNLMSPIIDCVENLCTLGEISDALRQVFGKYAG
jgi:methylmalonyl-CoA mutase N-terminal domain/subunit